MGCCVIALALMSQMYAGWCKLRAFAGYPVREWFDDGPALTPGLLWRQRLQKLRSSTAGRSVLATLVGAELAFLIVVLPGPHGLIAQHRAHLRQAVELIAEYGHVPRLVDLFCRPASVPAKPLAPGQDPERS